MEASIIILTYNSANHLTGLIPSLKNFAKDCEILIVDNKSADNTVEIAKKMNGVKVFETGENFGFAKGINYGARKAAGRYLLFLNPDTQIKKGTVSDLAEVFKKDEKVGVVGGKIMDFENKPEKSAGKFLNVFSVTAVILGLDELMRTRFSPNKTTPVDFVSGGFMMVEKEVFEKVGGFDENYFMYLEDMDLCFRLKKIGYKTIFSPAAVALHASHGSSNRSFAIVNIYKSTLYFFKNKKPSWEFELVKFGLHAKAFLVYLLGRITNNNYYIQAYGQALKLF